MEGHNLWQTEAEAEKKSYEYLESCTGMRQYCRCRPRRLLLMARTPEGHRETMGLMKLERSTSRDWMVLESGYFMS